MKRRALAAGTAAVALTFALAGCGTGGSPDSDDKAGSTSSRLYERTIDLKDGRTVTCVVYMQSNAGGLSCDWDGAAR